MLYSVYTGATDTRAEIDETGSKVKAKARIAQNSAMRAGVAAVLTTRAAERAAIPLQNGGTGVKAERKAAPVKKEKKEKNRGTRGAGTFPKGMWADSKPQHSCKCLERFTVYMLP